MTETIPLPVIITNFLSNNQEDQNKEAHLDPGGHQDEGGVRHLPGVEHLLHPLWNNQVAEPGGVCSSSIILVLLAAF